ncbi:MAG: YdcF family protein [Thermoguttaceae bacterium]
MKRLRRLLIRLLLITVVLVLLWVARVPLLRVAGRWLDAGSPPRPADYVMVLNGEENSRPLVAAALVRAQLAPQVLVAEVLASPDVIDRVRPPSHEINRMVLEKRGVPANRITILPGRAGTTHDEALALAAFLDNHRHAKVLVVTSDYHTRRSRWAFSRDLGDHSGQVLFVSAPTEECDVTRWWLDERGVATIASEYLKLAFYTARYGCALPWLAACACLAVVIRCARNRDAR